MDAKGYPPMPRVNKEESGTGRKYAPKGEDEQLATTVTSTGQNLDAFVQCWGRGKRAKKEQSTIKNTCALAYIKKKLYLCARFCFFIFGKV